MDLYNVSTVELIEELKNRDGMENGTLGVIRKYDLAPMHVYEIQHNEDFQEGLMTFHEYINTVLSLQEQGKLKSATRLGQTIIIKGKSGPTGKTTLAEILKKKGCNVIEANDEVHYIELNRLIKDAIPGLSEKVRF